MTETAPCTECQSPIPTEANRCPECGYAPQSEGKLTSTVLGVVIAPLFLVSGLVTVLIPVIAIGPGLPLGSALAGLILFGTTAIVSGAFLYTMYRKLTLKPTESLG